MLRGLASRFETETGETFNIGSLDEVEQELENLIEGREPVDILARLLAHLGHRIPLVNRVEKRLEGADKSSGIGSDLLAFIAVIWLRNRDALAKASRKVRESAVRAQKETAATPNGAGAVQPPEYRVPA